MSIIYFIVVLTITVMVHELGHFLLVKKIDVYVYEFSIGIGPKLFSKKKSETDYSICMLPIGGFFSIVGKIWKALVMCLKRDNYVIRAYFLDF